MKPLRVEARNYRSWQHLEFDFPEGVSALVGQNFAGKSSIVNVVDYALFGGSLASKWSGDGEMKLSCEFTHGREAYRVRRTYSGAGRGKSTLDFDRSDPGGDPYPWEPLTRQSIAETEKLISDTIGLSADTFRSSAFLRQGDAARFTAAQPRDRKRVFAEILRLERWDAMLEKERAAERFLREGQAGMSARISAAKEELEEAGRVDERLAAAKTVVTQAESALEALLTCEKELTEKKNVEQMAVSAHKLAKAELERAEAEAASLKEAVSQAKSAAEKREDAVAGVRQQEEVGKRLVGAQARLDELKAAAETYRRYQQDADQIERLFAEAAELEIEAASVSAGEVAECDRCGQGLGVEARKRAAESLSAQAKVVREKAVAMQWKDEPPIPPTAAELEAAELDVSDLAAVRQVIAGLTAQIRMYAETMLKVNNDEFKARMSQAATKLSSARTRLTETELALPDESEMAPLIAQLSQVAQKIASTRDQLHGASTLAARLAAQLERIEKVKAQLADDEAATAQGTRELEVIAGCIKAYGASGIPALILENSAIPQVEEWTQEFLSELGTDFRVELRTQRELKSGKGMADAMDIVILSPSIGEQLFEDLSGGEQTRVNLALRIALVRLLAHRSGAEVKMLVIDEPEYLDANGHEALVRVLERLVPEFEVIVIISHAPGLANAVSNVIRVEKSGRTSKLVEA